MNLNSRQEGLLNLLMKIPANLNKVEEYIIRESCTPEDTSVVGLKFVNNCWEEYTYIEDTDSYERCISHDKYVYEIIELLLKYGLDPNAIYDSENIMLSLTYIRHDYISADTMALLMEHGGDPNLVIDGERLFDIVDFDVTFGAIELYDRVLYDNLVHYWMVMVGYGGVPQCGATPLDTFYNTDCGQGISEEKFQLSELKNHRNYYMCLTHTPNRGNNWSLHIIDKNTLWEVARL